MWLKTVLVIKQQAKEKKLFVVNNTWAEHVAIAMSHDQGGAVLALQEAENENKKGF